MKFANLLALSLLLLPIYMCVGMNTNDQLRDKVYYKFIEIVCGKSLINIHHTFKNLYPEGYNIKNRKIIYDKNRKQLVVQSDDKNDDYELVLSEFIVNKILTANDNNPIDYVQQHLRNECYYQNKACIIQNVTTTVGAAISFDINTNHIGVLVGEKEIDDFLTNPKNKEANKAFDDNYYCRIFLGFMGIFVTYLHFK